MTDTTPITHVEFFDTRDSAGAIPIRWRERIDGTDRHRSGNWSDASEAMLRAHMNGSLAGGAKHRRMQALLDARLALSKAEIEGTRIVEAGGGVDAVLHPWGPSAHDTAGPDELRRQANDSDRALLERAALYMIAEVLQALRDVEQLPDHCTDERTFRPVTVETTTGDISAGLRAFGKVVREFSEAHPLRMGIDPAGVMHGTIGADDEGWNAEPRVARINEYSEPLRWVVVFEDGYVREVTPSDLARLDYITVAVTAVQVKRDEEAKRKLEQHREAEIERRARTMFEAAGYTGWTDTHELIHDGWLAAARIEAELEELRAGVRD